MVISRLSFTAMMTAIVMAPAAAQSATPIDQFRDWGAYVADTDNGKVCYALTQPQRMRPEGVNRGSVYLFISTRPDQGVVNEVSVVTGYPYEEGSQTIAEIGSESFTMFTENDSAWVENAAEEERLIQAMRAGTDMVVRGTSQRGTDTEDTYSLLGISAALDRIAQECD